MKLQAFALKDASIRKQFMRLKREKPDRFSRRLTLSFSTWLFGTEPLEESMARLKNAGLQYIELPGNHHSWQLGSDPRTVRRRLAEFDLTVSGICGLFFPENDLASNSPYRRQAAIDYLRREVEFTKEVGGQYVILVPSAVGRTAPIDESELDRSVEAARIAADYFHRAGVKAAVEPIRGAEVSLIHTVSQALDYIDRISHPGIQHINGDIYHMLSEENHIGEAILKTGERLVNLHLADSNRGALGDGVIDIDVVIMALYLIGHNNPGRFVTGEPLGPGGNPYHLMFGRPDSRYLDRLVNQTVSYFRDRENYLLQLDQ